MAYSKAKLKSNGDRASPCFKPFLIGNSSDKYTLPKKDHSISIRDVGNTVLAITAGDSGTRAQCLDHSGNWI